MCDKIKIGVLCPSEIAFRRFMPSLLKCDEFEYVGVAVADEEEWAETVSNKSAIAEIIKSENSKAQNFADTYGGKIFSSYKQLISDESIQAVYLPLPPALHYRWGREVILNKKHLLMEKPFTTEIEKSNILIDLAKENNLAVHENYMFVYHNQLNYIKNLMNSGDIGDIRHIRAAFTFPKRSANDFRYVKALGGGALLDCGGYPMRLMTELMGDFNVLASKLHYIEGFEVDMFGSVMLVNDKLSGYVSFGMDNTYKCEVEVQGSKGLIYTDRIFTAPDDFSPKICLNKNNESNIVQLDPDSTFVKSINRFYESIKDIDKRVEIYGQILTQAEIIEQIKE